MIVYLLFLVKELCDEYSMVYSCGEIDMEVINFRVFGKLNVVNSFLVFV